MGTRVGWVWGAHTPSRRPAHGATCACLHGRTPSRRAVSRSAACAFPHGRAGAPGLGIPALAPVGRLANHPTANGLGSRVSWARGAGTPSHRTASRGTAFGGRRTACSTTRTLPHYRTPGRRTASRSAARALLHGHAGAPGFDLGSLLAPGSRPAPTPPIRSGS